MYENKPAAQFHNLSRIQNSVYMQFNKANINNKTQQGKIIRIKNGALPKTNTKKIPDMCI